jgi:hypothetical protein
MLQPSAPLLVVPAPADAAGRAAASLPLPTAAAAPAIVGLPLGCQAIAVGGLGLAFSDVLVRPAIL